VGLLDRRAFLKELIASSEEAFCSFEGEKGAWEASFFLQMEGGLCPWITRMLGRGDGEAGGGRKFDKDLLSLL